jgi:hypothetical protein
MLAVLLAILTAPAASYAPCAHAPDQPAPVATRESQAAARAEIEDAVFEIGGSPAFAQYLIAVATRESSLRPGVIHVRDAASSSRAYRHKRKAHRAAGNPFADQPALWLTYGLFGLNSNYYARVLHPHADPRRLCSVRVSVATYARAAQGVLRRLPRACGITRPTWADIHRAIQGGDLCPDGGHERIPGSIAAGRVRLSDLGA